MSPAVAHRIRGRGRAALAALILVALLAGGGCSSMSVSHLDRRPWTAGAAEQQVEMTFWRFAYTVAETPVGFEVRGVARPKGNVPAWADFAEELWFAAYVANSKGEVLASQQASFKPGPLPAEGLPFTFAFASRKVRPMPGVTQLAFGYRMALVSAGEHARAEQRIGRDDPKRLFVAYELAVSRD